MKLTKPQQRTLLEIYEKTRYYAPSFLPVRTLEDEGLVRRVFGTNGWYSLTTGGVKEAERLSVKHPLRLVRRRLVTDALSPALSEIEMDSPSQDAAGTEDRALTAVWRSR